MKLAAAAQSGNQFAGKTEADNTLRVKQEDTKMRSAAEADLVNYVAGRRQG